MRSLAPTSRKFRPSQPRSRETKQWNGNESTRCRTTSTSITVPTSARASLARPVTGKFKPWNKFHERCSCAWGTACRATATLTPPCQLALRSPRAQPIVSRAIDELQRQTRPCHVSTPPLARRNQRRAGRVHGMATARRAARSSRHRERSIRLPSAVASQILDQHSGRPSTLSRIREAPWVNTSRLSSCPS